MSGIHSSAAAMAVLEELEETARLMVLSASPPLPLCAERIDALRQTFKARWQAKYWLNRPLALYLLA